MKNAQNKYAIILAGGSGTRFGAELPKQFVNLVNRPILMETIDVFRKIVEDDNIILVLPQKELSLWRNLCEKYNFESPSKIAFSGESRFHSVLNGLNLIDSDDGCVAIHDGVRPLVTESMINESFSVALQFGSAIPVVPLVDSVRILTGVASKALDRSSLRAVQTPQTFQLHIIKSAYAVPYSQKFTDDASVVEAMGEEVHLYDGDMKNIKITHSIDLEIAKLYLQQRK